ncbi:hypothetical protein ACFQY7_40385 [Actinomadura luteofluorescens]|uniref:hypothetical protein n=1 Tax=Actinomadura luteofluorescens TaxID=46163 RepID=UPI00363141A0
MLAPPQPVPDEVAGTEPGDPGRRDDLADRRSEQGVARTQRREGVPFTPPPIRVRSEGKTWK